MTRRASTIKNTHTQPETTHTCDEQYRQVPTDLTAAVPHPKAHLVVFFLVGVEVESREVVEEELMALAMVASSCCC
jgi:hypothetical protein